MKKLLLIAIPVLLLTGCNIKNPKYFDFKKSELIKVDKETCVQYIYHSKAYGGGFSVRLNADDTPMLDKE